MKKRIICLVTFAIVLVLSSYKSIMASSFNQKSKSIKIYEKYDLKNIITDYNVANTFSSSDSSIVEVTNDGVVTTKRLGRATVTMNDGSRNSQITINSGFYSGIDISTYNNNVNWAMVKGQGVDFVMIRAGYGWYDPEGVDYGRPFDCQVDDQLLNNMKGAIEYDIPFGVYHYSYADTLQKADQEADYIIQILDEYASAYKDKMTLPVAYDVEEKKQKVIGKAALTNIVIRFCSRLYEAGYTPIIYANGDFFANYLDLDRINALAYDIWYATWKNNVDFSQKMLISNTNQVPYMWQYSASGYVEGANTDSGTIDLNLMYMKDRVKVEVFDENNQLMDTIGADKGGILDYFPEYEKQGYKVSFEDLTSNIITENTIFNENSIIRAKLEKNAVTSISLNINNINLNTLNPENEYVLSIDSYTPENAILQNEDIEFVSSDESVATIDSNGKISFVGKGECIITAYLKADSSVKDECVIKIEPVIQKGDISEDGFINAIDASIVLDRYKNNDATEKDFELADMNNDGMLNSIDAAMILDIFKSL